MDINLFTRFFMWCTIINVSLLTFWFAIYLFASDLVYLTLPLKTEPLQS